MELSRGILKRVLSAALCLVLLGMCTGCSATDYESLHVKITDYLRPDLNLANGVRIFMDKEEDEGEEGGDGSDSTVQPGEKASIVQTVWSGGSPNTGSFSYKNPSRDEDTSTFAATTVATVEATDYGQYLRTEVYEKLLAVIEDLDPEVQAKLYIRCGHTGYDFQNGKMRKVSGWSATTAGHTVASSKLVGGSSLVTLATDWVGHLSLNGEHKDTQVAYAQNNIKAYVDEDDMSKNWYELADSKLPAVYRKMMGRDSANFKTLQEYYDAIGTDPYRNIPNYNLYYYTGVTTNNKMTFNQVNGNAIDKYVEGVPITTVDKLFSTYNQYSTRDRTVTKNVVTDDDSIVKYFLDGYNKTVIFVGTTAGGSLKDTVGATAYSEILKLVSNAYMCTDVSSITSKSDYADFTVIPAGSKGVD